MPSLELILAFLHPQVILFLLFGLGALATALTMLLHPNPVRAALFLVLNLFCVGVLYLFLNAYFLAAVQVVVYAGAIMVLFLFVIMLLNLGAIDRTVDRLRIQQPLAALAGVVLAASIAVTLVRTMPLPVLDEAGNVPVQERSDSRRVSARAASVAGTQQGAGQAGSPSSADVASGPSPENAPQPVFAPVSPAEQGTVAGVGKTLYNPNLPYLFAFEVTSILLLIATIGAVVLAQRKTPAERSLEAEELA